MIAVLAYLFVITALTFAVFADDKRRAAAESRRTPERVLLTLAAAGGTVGAFAARQLLRHKTRKQPFSAWLWLIATAQVVAVAVAASWIRP
jgi:uncharacterized membrane protein YsdA (DUF1294 family)